MLNSDFFFGFFFSRRKKNITVSECKFCEIGKSFSYPDDRYRRTHSCVRSFVGLLDNFGHQYIVSGARNLF